MTVAFGSRRGMNRHRPIWPRSSLFAAIGGGRAGDSGRARSSTAHQPWRRRRPGLNRGTTAAPWRRYGALSILAAVLAWMPQQRGHGAEPAGAHLRRMLDSTLQMTLHHTPVAEAFSDLARAADISIEVEESVYDRLPYGADTRIDVTFHNVRVEKALRTLLRRMDLRLSLSDGHVVIRPGVALTRLGRRATWNELVLLRRIAATPLTRANDDWLGTLAGLLKTPRLQIAIAPAPAARRAAALAALRAALPCTIDRALTTYARALHMIWFLHRRSLDIATPRAWVRRQLDRPIAVKQTNAPLEQVVAELAALSGVRFKPEPGLYLLVPRVSIDSNDGTIRQTLDALSGATGIAYHIAGDAVVLQMPRSAGPSGVGADPVVATLAVPFGPNHQKIDVFIRASELPAPLRRRLAQKVRQAVQALATTQTPKTSSPPTTQPTPSR